MDECAAHNAPVQKATHDAAMATKVKEEEDMTILDSTQAEQQDSASAINKQKNRRDLFMMIHKEVQNPHLQPRPPLPLQLTDKICSNPESLVGDDSDLAHRKGSTSELKNDEKQPKQRGRPRGQKNKAVTLNGLEDGAPKRTKRSILPKLHNSAEIGKPVAPLYAYELFSRDYLRAYMAANRDAANMTQEELNAVTLNEWKSMSDQSKKPYVARATQDQQQYHEQVQLWEKNKTQNGNALPVTAPQQCGKDHGPPRPRGRPRLVIDHSKTGTDNDGQVIITAVQNKDNSPKPRGRPKFGYVWDSPSGQWVKKSPIVTGVSSNDVNQKVTDAITRNADVAAKNDAMQKSTDRAKGIDEDAVVGSSSTAITESSSKDDDRWYSKLQSTPTSTKPSEGHHLEEQHKTARSIGGTAQRASQLPRKQNILNPKRPPKFNQDGSYRKPGGPQPIGYKWNAEYGYWESVISSDSNLQRILNFDQDEGEGSSMSKPQVRRLSTGNAPTIAQRKRKYTEDGCIIPRQTLERLTDGTYVRPMGRPIVGYSWDGSRGLWIPASQMEHRHSLSSMEQKVHQRKMSSTSAGNKTRLYTSDGCILPAKTPTKSNDGLFIRPFGRSIVGYTWDYHRGVWAPTGAPIPTKNTMPLPPSHFAGPTRFADKVVDENKYMACTKCDACKMKENCDTCLYCKILESMTNHTKVPYLICSYRICQEPVLNPKYTKNKFSIQNEPRKEIIAPNEEEIDNDNNTQHSDDEEDDDVEEDDDGADQWRNTDRVTETEQASVDNDDIDEDDSILESLSDGNGDDDDDNLMTDLEND
jgi:hypothetical protein